MEYYRSRSIDTLYKCEGIFAGGDIVTGPKTVTEGMTQVKITAQMIHVYIKSVIVRR